MVELSFEHLIVAEAAPHVTAVTLNRPDVLNAINTKLSEEIYATFTALDDDAETRSIVLRGAGERAFCTGADLKERAGMTDQVWHAQHRVFEAAFRSILECRHPVIAAVEGYALAGGLELALNCDIIIAGSGASFAQPEVMRGIMP